MDATHVNLAGRGLRERVGSADATHVFGGRAMFPDIRPRHAPRPPSGRGSRERRQTTHVNLAGRGLHEARCVRADATHVFGGRAMFRIYDRDTRRDRRRAGGSRERRQM